MTPADVSTPAANHWAVFMGDDGAIYAMDDGGSITALGGGGGGSVADADYGDVVVSSSGTVWTVENVTEAKQVLADNTTANASTTKHGYLLKATAPSAGLRNVVAIDNGETVYKNAALFDATNPADLGSASPGSAMTAARRDHVHNSPGGGSSLGIWLPDAPPSSAGADDDEFADASGGVPSGWTEVDHGNHMSVDEDAVGLELASTATGGSYENAGIYKAIPAGDFTIWTKLSHIGVADTSYVLGGLALWEDATNSTKKVELFYNFLQSGGGTSSIAVYEYTNYNTAGSAAKSSSSFGTVYNPTAIYMRIRRNSTTYSFDYSTDGIGWMQFYSGSLSFTPTHYGPLCGVNHNQANHERYAFFRYKSSDITVAGITEGNRV